MYEGTPSFIKIDVKGHELSIHHSPYIVDFRSAEGVPYDHRSVANTDTRFEPNILGRGCMAPSLDGARSGPLAHTLFGAKHGGHCHRQSASTFPSFRRQMLRNS